MRRIKSCPAKLCEGKNIIENKPNFLIKRVQSCQINLCDMVNRKKIIESKKDNKPKNIYIFPKFCNNIINFEKKKDVELDDKLKKNNKINLLFLDSSINTFNEIISDDTILSKDISPFVTYFTSYFLDNFNKENTIEKIKEYIYKNLIKYILIYGIHHNLINISIEKAKEFLCIS